MTDKMVLKIMRDKIYLKTIVTEFFTCRHCGAEITDIETDFNRIEDWIVFECPHCGGELQVEPPRKVSP